MNPAIKTLGTVATYINGRAFKPSEWEKIGLPIIRIQNLTDSNASYNYSSVMHEEKFLVKKGDLLFAWSASLGAHIWGGNDAWLNQHIFKIIPNEGIDKKYLYYYLLKVVSDLYSKSHGTGMVHITKKPFMETKIPVPVLEEQKQIVDYIEATLSQLDDGIETLKKTQQQLTVYRQAVLATAFSSGYYKTKPLSSIVDDIRIGPFGTMLHKEDYIINGIPVINPQHIKKRAINYSNRVTVSAKKADELKSYKLRTNDVVMGRRGEMGRTAPISKNEDGWICGTGSIIIRLKPEYDAVLYSQVLSSPEVVRFLEENATGTTMKNLNEDIVKRVPVPVITKEMQIKITMRNEKVLSNCETIEKTVNSALQEAESLRQSILKQAFEGEQS